MHADFSVSIIIGLYSFYPSFDDIDNEPFRFYWFVAGLAAAGFSVRDWIERTKAFMIWIVFDLADIDQTTRESGPESSGQWAAKKWEQCNENPTICQGIQ